MGRPPVITRDKAAEIALQIVDEDGVDGLSLERLAKAMGVRGPSLYHHFKDKTEILTEVANLVIGDLDLQSLDGVPWDEWMVQVALRFSSRVHDHPKAAPILVQFIPEYPFLAGHGRAAKMMTAAGVDESIQLLLLEGTEKISWGWAIHGAISADQRPNRLTSNKAARRWPELATAIRESRWQDQALIEASLRAFVNGVKLMIDEQSNGARATAASKPRTPKAAAAKPRTPKATAATTRRAAPAPAPR